MKKKTCNKDLRIDMKIKKHTIKIVKDIREQELSRIQNKKINEMITVVFPKKEVLMLENKLFPNSNNLTTETNNRSV